MLDNIFEQLMYTTLRIECIDSIGNIFSIGTGFLIQRPVGDNKYKLYLVSNSMFCAIQIQLQYLLLQIREMNQMLVTGYVCQYQI